MKIALVHDYLREWGGAEEVLQVLREMWPDAPIYTSYAMKSLKSHLGDGIACSWLDSLPHTIKSWNGLTPLLPSAFQSFNFSNYDVVISSASSFAKCIKVEKPTIHICYCHTPPRFLYGLNRERKESMGLDIVEAMFRPYLRAQDMAAAKKVDLFVANSHVVANRIRAVYSRGAAVVYPPVKLEKFQLQGEIALQNYFVIIGRLSPIKQFDLAIKACTQQKIPLKVIGSGLQEDYLKSIAGPSVEFLGRLDDDAAAQVIARSLGAISPVIDEDFGIVPIEVLAAGKPVIAFASEAAKETLDPGITGEFFYEPTVESLGNVLAKFLPTRYDSAKLRDYANRFRKERFIQKMTAVVESAMKQ